ncbi:ankyrin repeat-containing domain protein [Hypomontagnella monticulosa]|nr:ankyrin repeat-containing domain protein [Hypomontagnella monticulosa]
MSDPLSVAGSIVGVVSLAVTVFQTINEYCRKVKGAKEHVEAVATETRNLCAILYNLQLRVSAEWTEEPLHFYSNRTLADDCQRTLVRIHAKLKKARRDFDGDSKLGHLTRSLKWPFSRSETDDLLKELAGHRSNIDLALAVDSTEMFMKMLSRQNATNEKQDNLQQSLDDVGNVVGEIRDATQKKFEIDTRVQMEEKQQKVLKFFLKVNPRTNLEMCWNLREADTGRWLLDDEDYKEWRDETNTRIWFSGIPGAGKTVLCGTVIEDVLQLTNEMTALAYFFCDYKDSESLKLENILSSLATQLAIQSADAFNRLERYYDELHPEHGLERPLDVKTFVHLLKHISSCFQKVYIVVDALDECESQVAEVADTLRDLAYSSDITSMALFSREREDIDEILADEFYNVDIMAQKGDLEIYVGVEMARRRSLRDLPVKNPQLNQEIREYLIDRAQGMFRWVFCQIDHLASLPSHKARRKALRNLPPTLHGAYQRILELVAKRSSEEGIIAARALHWIGAARPALRITELCEAISLDGDGNDEDHNIDPEDIVDESAILRCCKSLIRKSQDGIYFEFAHFTVQEYLASIDPNSSLGQFYYDKDTARLSLAKISLRYLMLPKFDCVPPTDALKIREAQKRMKEEHPFYYYSAYHPPWNLNHNMEDGEVLRLAARFFHKDRRGYLLNWAVEYLDYIEDLEDATIGDLANLIRDPELSSLHLAALLGLPEICQTLIFVGEDVNNFYLHSTPLHCALVGPRELFGWDTRLSQTQEASNDYGDVPGTVEILLMSGANEETLWRMQSPSRMALDWCFNRRKSAVILLFLRHNTSFVEDTIKALQRILNRDSRGAYATEIAQGIMISYAERSSPFPIFSQMASMAQAAALNMNLEEIQSPQDGILGSRLSDADYHIALRAAIEAAKESEIFQLILDPRFDPKDESFSEGSGSIIHLASEKGNVHVTKRLIRKGFDINAQDADGSTPLSICCQYGCVSVLNILLDESADTTVADNQTRTIWHWAARYNSVSILEVLADKDAHGIDALRTVSKSGLTPLQYALWYGCKEAAEFILRKFSIDNAFLNDKGEGSILRKAASIGSIHLFRSLLSWGADRDKTGYCGETPLHAVLYHTEEGFIPYLKTLYDIKSKRDDGRVPIEAVILEVKNSPSLAYSNEERYLLWAWDSDDSDALSDISDMTDESGITSDSELKEKLEDLNVYELRHLMSSELLESLSAEGKDIWDLFCREVVGTRNSHWSRQAYILRVLTDALIEKGALKVYEDTHKRSGALPFLSASLKYDGPRKREDWSLLKYILIKTKHIKDLHTHELGAKLLAKMIRDGRQTRLQFVLSLGFSVHDRIGGQMSALEVAAARNIHPSTFEKVLNFIDHTKLDEDLSSDGKTLLDILIFASARQSDLSISYHRESQEKMSQLLIKGADPNACDQTDQKSTPIIHAVILGCDASIIELLLHHGADPELRNANGIDALMTSVAVRNTNAVAIILEKVRPGYNFEASIQPDPQSPTPCTLFHFACAKNQVNMVRHLLDNHLVDDVNMPDPISKRTPLHFCAANNAGKTTNLLLSRGASCEITDAEGLLPIDVALNHNRFGVAQTLWNASTGSSG